MMECPHCQHDNHEGTRSCDACGTPLDGLLACCGRAAGFDARAYTPRHLAETILTRRAALEGERKQVTVLFADVVDSMRLAEGLDPEDWHRVLDRVFDILARSIHRFEGTINQFTGDGV